MIDKEELAALKQQAYTIITRDPRAAFPEFGFRQGSGGWCSTATTKIDGSTGREAGKVWIYSNNPGVIIDYRGEEKKTFWDYFEEYQHVPRRDVLPRLLELAGLELPVINRKKNDSKPLDGVHPAVLKTAHEYFQQQLWSDAGKATLAYLIQRGYDEDTIKSMKLGFIPSKTEIRDHLLFRNIDTPYIDFLLRRISDTIPDTHPLALPCYGKQGVLEGFIFRLVDEALIVTTDNPPTKYLNMTKLNRSDGLLNFQTGTDEIIIVEGVIDALLAQAKGLQNVVSLNGARVNSAQLDALKEANIKTITLCLDNDAAGKKAASAIVQKIMRSGHNFSVYIAGIPAPYIDVDDLLKQFDGEKVFNKIYQESASLGSFVGNEFLAKHCSDGIRFLRERNKILSEYAELKALLRCPNDTYDLGLAVLNILNDRNISIEILNTISPQ